MTKVLEKSFMWTDINLTLPTVVRFTVVSFFEALATVLNAELQIPELWFYIFVVERPYQACYQASDVYNEPTFFFHIQFKLLSN